MAKIIAAIIAAIVQIISPLTDNTNQEFVHAQDNPINGPAAVHQEVNSQGIPHLINEDDIQAIANKYANLLPTPPVTPHDMEEYQQSLQQFRKEVREEVKGIVEDRRNDDDSIVPCLDTSCKPKTTPIPMPTRIIEPTVIPYPTSIPLPTYRPKPTITYIPSPFPTYVIPTYSPWPPREPNPCPSIPPYMVYESDGYPYGEMPTRLIDPIICLDGYSF